jgi:hypothetical protein
VEFIIQIGSTSPHFELHVNIASESESFENVPLQVPTESSLYTLKPTNYDRTIPYSKSDILLQDGKEIFVLIDVSGPPDQDVTKKEVEGILKYEDLLIVV